VALPAGLGWREFRQPSSLAGLAESNFGPAYLLVEAATGRRARWQLLDGIYAGQPLFTSRLRANAQSGLRARTDHGKWSAALEAALTATLQDDLQDGTTAASQARLCLRNGGSISGSGWLDAAARPISDLGRLLRAAMEQPATHDAPRLLWKRWRVYHPDWNRPDVVNLRRVSQLRSQG
jgi:hypothetical protein